ncbi:S24 family peptidase [Kerstersia gyiorum]|uniref:S24 family peptidase n=1 Tax=Kerstersia gyiorum TaxID=206506 RepID=UPI0030CB1C45
MDALLDRTEFVFSPAPDGHSNESRFDVLDVRAACGDGYVNDDHPEVVSTMFIPAQVAQAMIGTTNRSGSVKIVTAAKDSMAPTINPDDLLFVDTSVTEYAGETVYLIRHGGELLCKRLSLAGRDIVVSSDNDKYPQWKWSERPDETCIIGRVVRVLPIQFKKFSSD